MSGETCDVLIVGGGMVGATLAQSLAPLPLQTLVIDSRPTSLPNPAQGSFDSRITALANGSQRILSAIGLWPQLQPHVQPILSIHVSDQGGFGFARLDARSEGVTALGYTVDNGTLVRCLDEARSKDTGARFWPCTHLEDLQVGSDEVVARVKRDGGKESTVAAKLVIAADGAGSRVRDQLQLRVDRHDYGQTAIIANLSLAQPHHGRAFERFTSAGPLAMLPIPQQCMGVVWTLSRKRAAAAADWDDDEFRNRLQQQFGYRLGRLGAVGPRASYPLVASHATRIVAARALLVGNAANTLHPVAGQGFNLALRDIAAVAEILCRACQRGMIEDVGASSVVDRYQDWRRSDHRRVRWFTHNLVQLFGSRRSSLQIGRDLGLLAFDLLPGTKSRLARYTMGIGGRLPRLARGVSLVE